MKKILFFTIFLFIQNLLTAQLVPYLWNENINLKKEEYSWKEKTTYSTEIKEDNRVEYCSSKVKIEEDGGREITLFDKSGQISELNHVRMEGELLEIFETADGNKEEKRYNDKGNLISETWFYPDGSKDEKIFEYEGENLIKIVETDEFGNAMEELKYDEGKLSQILSVSKRGKVLMERKIIYDAEGRIKETQRIQKRKINKRTFYQYDENGRLIEKEEEMISRLTGEKIPPEIYEYAYHANGILKEEKWLVFTDETREYIKYEVIETYNELGLEIKSIMNDYRRDVFEITDYKYKMKD